VKLESKPSSKELLASIFRTIHTIKGSCGFLGFACLEKVAQAGESLRSLLRDGKLGLSEEVTSGLLAMVDAVHCMLAEIQAREHDGENDYPELRERLKQLQGGGNAKPAPTAGASVPVAVPQRLASACRGESRELARECHGDTAEPGNARTRIWSADRPGWSQPAR
jgi:two-component system chemotaxis sensor kinase CheA